jgi:hypothetical protein
MEEETELFNILWHVRSRADVSVNPGTILGECV